MDQFLSKGRVIGAVLAVEASSYTMSGPFNLVQGGFAVIGRLPVWTPAAALVDGTMTVSDIERLTGATLHVPASRAGHNFWGFVTILIDFEKLVEQSGLRKLADEQNLVFTLSTVNRADNSTTIIASSQNDTDSLMVVASCCTATIEKSAGGEGPEPWSLTISPQQGFTPSYLSNTVIISVSVTASLLASLSVVALCAIHKLRRHSRLLYTMLPKHAVRRLIRGEQVVEYFEEVTIFFSDLVGYTNISSQMHPLELFAMLNALYSAFDELAEKHGVTKIETIGDAYLVIGGAPHRADSGPTAAKKVSLFALDAIDLVNSLVESRREKGQPALNVRCGMSSGPVVAGILGTTVPKFSYWGDTVNMASRMESTSETGKLQITEHTKRLLDEAQGDGHSFSIAIAERMEAVQVKGIGRMKTWYVTRCADAIIANTHVSATVISASTHTLARRSSLGAAALGLDIHRQSSSRGMGSIA